MIYPPFDEWLNDDCFFLKLDAPPFFKPYPLLPSLYEREGIPLFGKEGAGEIS
jgi:hypothetical protein